MIELKINKNVIYKDDKVLKKFSQTLNKFLLLDENTIILLFEIQENKEFNNNVICIDMKGEYKWRIESYNYPHNFCPVTNIYLYEKSLFVYRRCGIEEEINTHNGLILSSELIK